MLELNKVYMMDCLDGIEKLKNNSIKLAIIDPPYNVGYKYNSYKDNLPYKEYILWQSEIINKLIDKLTEDGSIWYLNYPENCFDIYKHVEIPLFQVIFWTPNAHVPTKKIGFRKASRIWMWFSKSENPVWNPEGAKGEYKNKNDKRIKKKISEGKFPIDYDFWTFQPVKNVSKEKTEHPCQLPEKMIERIISTCSNENDIVLDPFMGSGTTAFVAKKLKRQYIGFEIDEKYIHIIENRVSNL